MRFLRPTVDSKSLPLSWALSLETLTSSSMIRAGERLKRSYRRWGSSVDWPSTLLSSSSNWPGPVTDCRSNKTLLFKRGYVYRIRMSSLAGCVPVGKSGALFTPFILHSGHQLALVIQWLIQVFQLQIRLCESQYEQTLALPLPYLLVYTAYLGVQPTGECPLSFMRDSYVHRMKNIYIVLRAPTKAQPHSKH